jgi:hypothetical protein
MRFLIQVPKIEIIIKKDSPSAEKNGIILTLNRPKCLCLFHALVPAAKSPHSGWLETDLADCQSETKNGNPVMQ